MSNFLFVCVCIELNKSHLKFGDKYAKAVSEALSSMDGLRSFDLRDNRLSTVGLDMIFSSLQPRLEELDVSQNIFRKLDFENLVVQMDRNCPYLRILKMEKCGIQDGHLEILFRSYRRQGLVVLDLSQNQITGGGGLSLEKLIVGNQDLKELYLSWNQINAEGGICILEGLR
jgi:Leucine-rich repeat (LRR) protein